MTTPPIPRTRSPISNPQSPTTLAAIICTRNRPRELARCLASLAAQTRPADEIIIVDASDGVMDDGRRTMDDGPSSIIDPQSLILPSPPGLPAQRNLGLQHTQADVVAFFDDDVELDPGYLAALMAVYARRWREQIGGVMGSEPGWRQSSAAAHGLKRLFGLTHVRAAAGAVRVSAALGVAWVARPEREIPAQALVGFCMSYRRAAISAMDLHFDEALGGYADGEDVDFSYRLGQRYTLWQTPAATLVHHRARAGRAGLQRRFYTRTRNEKYLHRKLLPQTGRNRLAWAWAGLGRLLLALAVSLRRGTPAPLLGTLSGLGQRSVISD